MAPSKGSILGFYMHVISDLLIHMSSTRRELLFKFLSTDTREVWQKYFQVINLVCMIPSMRCGAWG
jgi:hypothetical protein